jgi:Spy/CpxP family protein refolding chaperone
MLRVQTLAFALLASVLLIGQLAPAGAQGQGGPGGRMQPIDLKLTADQQAKAQAIYDAARTQALAVFTADQLKQFTPIEQQAIQMGLLQIKRGAQQGELTLNAATELAALKLTDDQQAKIKKIADDANTKAQAVPTDDRRTQMTQIRGITTAAGAQIWDVLAADQQVDVRKTMDGNRHTILGLRVRGLSDLQLTDDQTTKLQAIQTQAQKDFRAILTPDQQTQFDQIPTARGQRGGGN